MKQQITKFLIFLFFGQANSQQQAILTKAEEQCYRDRYTDIKNQDPTKHYNTIGVRQGRTYTCAPPITQTMALRFGLSSASLMMGIGPAARDEETIKTKAAEYFKTIGFSSSSNQGSSWNGLTNPQRCADAPEGRCNTCQGTMYLGLDKRPDNGKIITTIEELLLFRNFARSSNKQGILCHETSFGDGLTGVYFNRWTDDKQIFDDDTQKCFCEPDIEDHTYACSDENLNCYCPSGGQVLFGRKYDPNTGKRHNFNSLKNTGEYSILSVAQKETVACVSSQINGYDPAPGVEKACFCGYQEKDKIPEDIVASQLEVIKQKKESDQAEKDKQTAQATADVEKEKAREQIAKAQQELLKAKAEKDKQLKEAAKKEADEKAAIEKKLKDDLKAAEAQKKADADKLKELQAEQKRLEKEAIDAQKKVDIASVKVDKAKEKEVIQAIKCPSPLSSLGTFKVADANLQITVNTDSILLNDNSFKLVTVYDFTKVSDCVWESKKWDRNRGSRWTYDSDGDQWQETSLKGKGPWKAGFMNWPRLKIYDSSKYLGTFKVSNANQQITFNPQSVLLNEDMSKLGQIFDYKRVAEGVWENKATGHRWSYVPEGDYFRETTLKGKSPWKEGFQRWLRKQQYSPESYLGTFKVADANLQLTLNPESVLFNEDMFKFGQIPDFKNIADGVWESTTWDHNRGSRWTYVPEGDYLRETSLKGKGPWKDGFMKWPRITFYNPEKYLGMFKVADANLRVTLNPDFATLNEDALALGKNSDFKRIKQGIWENPKWDNNRGSRWTYIPEFDYLKETSLTGPGPWKGGSMKWPRAKTYSLDKALGTFGVNGQSTITINPNNVILNPDLLKIGSPSDFKKVDDGVWENPKWLRGAGSRWTYVPEGDYMLETCMTGVGPWPEGSLKWPRIQLYYPSKYLGTFKVADANLQVTINPDSVLLNDDSLRFGKTQDFNKVADGVWESHAWDHNRGSRFTYIPVGDYLLETSLTGNGPWPAGYMKWPRIQIYFPEKYLGTFKVADANLQLTLNPESVLFNEDMFKFGQIPDFKKIADGIWESTTWDRNRGSRWTYVPEGDYLRETSLTGKGPWNQGFMKWPRQGFFNADKYLGTFKVADADLKITLNPESVQLNEDSLKLGSSLNFKKITDGIWESTTWDRNRGSRWTYVPEGDYLRETSLKGKGPWPKGSMKWPREVVLSPIQQSEKAKAALILKYEEDKQVAIQASINAAIAKKVFDYQKEVNEINAAEENARIKREHKAALEKSAEDKKRSELEAAHLAARKAAEAARQEAFAKEKAAQAEANKANYDKIIASAYEKMRAAFEAKVVREDANALKKQHDFEIEMKAQAEERERLRQAAAKEKDRAWKAAVKARKLAAETEKKSREFLIAQEKQKRKIDEFQLQRDLALQKAQQAVKKAEEEFKLAKTEIERQKAEEAKNRAESAFKKAQDSISKANAKKAKIEADIKAQKELQKQLDFEAERAEKESRRAQERELSWKKQAADAKEKAKKQIATLDAARKAKAKANKIFREKSKAKLDQALKSLKKNLAAAKAQADAAHAAQEALRLQRELDQKLDHEKQMSERIHEFKSKYPNVWASGRTGLLWAQASMEAKNGLNEDFVKDVILKNIAADCVISKKRFGRNFRNSGHNDAGYFRHKLFCIVSETYADMFMNEMQSKVPLAHTSPNIPIDVVFSPIVTGSKSYIEWGRKHTNRAEITANIFSKH